VTAQRAARVVLIVGAALCVIYMADAFALRGSNHPFGTVQVRRYYAMPLKGGKTEYGNAGVEDETCVHSMFPHADLPPCWYASRKTEKWVTQ
jgi:hypothetical protein